MVNLLTWWIKSFSSLPGTNLLYFALLEFGSLSHSVRLPRFVIVVAIVIIIIIIIVVLIISSIIIICINIFSHQSRSISFVASSLHLPSPHKPGGANICQKKNSQILVAVLKSKTFSNLQNIQNSQNILEFLSQFSMAKHQNTRQLITMTFQMADFRAWVTLALVQPNNSLWQVIFCQKKVTAKIWQLSKFSKI